MYQKNIKRLFDFFFASIAFLLWLPFFGIIALLIKIDSKGPVFFKQKRIGQYKKEFMILKFRSMSMETPQNKATHLLDNPEQYITKVGRVLRKTSLDELPQLINVILGHMSIVGPRPALYNQYSLIAKRDDHGINDVRPGLTGLAQISGRDELPEDEKVKYDAIYVKSISFFRDLKYIIKTFKSVSKAEGIVEGRSEER